MCPVVDSFLVPCCGKMDGLGATRGRRKKTAAERRPQGKRAEARCAQKHLVAFMSVAEHRGNHLGILSLALAKVLSPALLTLLP